MKQQDKSLWHAMSQHYRDRLLWGLWFITWLGLLGGIVNHIFYEYVVLFSAVHALFILILLNFRVTVFSAQVRIAYLIWVMAGTYVPYMEILMYITTVGLATNLFFGYCPLARLLYLLPWNREEKFTPQLIIQVFFSKPVTGKFSLTTSAG